MKLFKSYLKNSIALAAILSGCATNNQPPVSISKGAVSSDNIYALYCANNKQTRRLRVPIVYFVPQLNKMAVDEAAKSHAHYAQQKTRFLKRALFSLSGVDTPGSKGADYLYVKQPSQTYKELMSILDERVSQPLSGRARIERPTDSDKFVLFHTTEWEHSDERYERNSAYVSELRLLVDNFTLLEPIEFQNEAYKCGEKCNDPDKVELIAIDEGKSHKVNGEIVEEKPKNSIAKAISYKDDIWFRYIERFTTIKEAKSNNARVINVDLELDLNAFCKYGRDLSDLQSQ